MTSLDSLATFQGLSCHCDLWLWILLNSSGLAGHTPDNTNYLRGKKWNLVNVVIGIESEIFAIKNILTTYVILQDNKNLKFLKIDSQNMSCENTSVNEL